MSLKKNESTNKKLNYQLTSQMMAFSPRLKEGYLK